MQFLPMLLFSLPAGALADRVDKRSLLLAAQTLALGQALPLGVLVTVGTPQVWQLVLLAVALGVSNAVNRLRGIRNTANGVQLVPPVRGYPRWPVHRPSCDD